MLKRRPDVQVRVLGAEIRPGELAELRQVAGARGLGGRLEFPDWVDSDEYQRWLGEATVAIQLRGYVPESPSASVADCLAAGVPVVVNDFGPLAELPGEVVLRVRKHPSAYEVADAVVALLDDADRRASLSAAALRHVEANDADRAARALLDMIRA